MKPAMTPQQEKLTGSKISPLALYKELAVGNVPWWTFAYYEICQLFLSGLPGLLGFGLRSKLYPYLFQSCAKRPAFGKGVIIRGAKAIALGEKVLADDYSVLDVRGEKGRMRVGNFVSIGRFTSVVAKNGEILLEDGVNIGSYCRVATESKVKLGASTLVAAYCYIGPGNHQQGDEQTPLIAREMEIKGGVDIGQYCWLGAHSTVLDGVTIGDGSIIGAHSLVKSDIPSHVIAAGVPARVIREIKS